MRISPSFETLAALTLRMRKSSGFFGGLTLRSVAKQRVSKGEAATCDFPASLSPSL
jgi:hypothetical protein